MKNFQASNFMLCCAVFVICFFAFSLSVHARSEQRKIKLKPLRYVKDLYRFGASNKFPVHSLLFRDPSSTFLYRNKHCIKCKTNRRRSSPTTNHEIRTSPLDDEWIIASASSNSISESNGWNTGQTSENNGWSNPVDSWEDSWRYGDTSSTRTRNPGWMPRGYKHKQKQRPLRDDRTSITIHLPNTLSKLLNKKLKKLNKFKSKGKGNRPKKPPHKEYAPAFISYGPIYGPPPPVVKQSTSNSWTSTGTNEINEVPEWVSNPPKSTNSWTESNPQHSPPQNPWPTSSTQEPKAPTSPTQASWSTAPGPTGWDSTQSQENSGCNDWPSQTGPSGNSNGGSSQGTTGGTGWGSVPSQGTTGGSNKWPSQTGPSGNNNVGPSQGTTGGTGWGSSPSQGTTGGSNKWPSQSGPSNNVGSSQTGTNSGKWPQNGGSTNSNQEGWTTWNEQGNQQKQQGWSSPQQGQSIPKPTYGPPVRFSPTMQSSYRPNQNNQRPGGYQPPTSWNPLPNNAKHGSTRPSFQIQQSQDYTPPSTNYGPPTGNSGGSMSWNSWSTSSPSTSNSPPNWVSWSNTGSNTNRNVRPPTTGSEWKQGRPPPAGQWSNGHSTRKRHSIPMNFGPPMHNFGPPKSSYGQPPPIIGDPPVDPYAPKHDIYRYKNYKEKTPNQLESISQTPSQKPMNSRRSSHRRHSNTDNYAQSSEERIHKKKYVKYVKNYSRNLKYRKQKGRNRKKYGQTSTVSSLKANADNFERPPPHFDTNYNSPGLSKDLKIVDWMPYSTKKYYDLPGTRTGRWGSAFKAKYTTLPDSLDDHIPDPSHQNYPKITYNSFRSRRTVPLALESSLIPCEICSRT